jgi:hypothetical protein
MIKHGVRSQWESFAVDTWVGFQKLPAYECVCVSRAQLLIKTLMSDGSCDARFQLQHICEGEESVLLTSAQ